MTTTYTCYVLSSAGNRADDGVGGPDPMRDRQIAAASAAEAAAIAVGQWRAEREFFAGDCGSPAVLVDGIEHVPEQYATADDSHTYDTD